MSKPLTRDQEAKTAPNTSSSACQAYRKAAILKAQSPIAAHSPHPL